MLCRQCGTEIAEKALICYRCGAATTEPKYKAPVRRERRPLSTLLTVLVLLLLVVTGLYLTLFVQNGERDAVRWVIIGLAAAIIALRAVARFRRVR
jgi:hypothetical protein